jgi:rhamnopyranosyl-N-acetylglucosaminyl-diphospho-decaprenol beta-1,3/1,4-galactofuranosyltransferase
MNEIAAIIVTYNRLELLKQCYNALLAQSYKAYDIIVVNNDSVDGTTEWLNSLNNVIVINQENNGSAGGFYAGMKYAYEKGYEWLWMMDDDGFPAKNEFEQLLTGAQKYSLDYANALVVNIEDKFSLSFGLEKEKTSIDDYKGVDVIYNIVCPFNGTLINRKVPEQIGFIKKEMFIWGDEVEYFLRTMKNGFSVGTIIKSIHYHPNNKNKESIVNVFPFIKKWKVVIKLSSNMNYLYYRNTGYNTYTYSKIAFYKIFIKYSVYFTFKLDYTGCKNFIVAYVNGSRNKF